MKRKRFSVEQIVAVLKQAEVGVPVAELIRQVGISEQTLYRWKKQYKGLETDQVRQFKQLQEENGRLKRLVAELTLDYFSGAGHSRPSTAVGRSQLFQKAADLCSRRPVRCWVLHKREKNIKTHSCIGVGKFGRQFQCCSGILTSCDWQDRVGVEMSPTRG